MRVRCFGSFRPRRQGWGAATGLDWANVRRDLRKQLGRWKLTKLFGLNNVASTDNAIPLFHQTCADSKELMRYFAHISSLVNTCPPCPIIWQERSVPLPWNCSRTSFFTRNRPAEAWLFANIIRSQSTFSFAFATLALESSIESEDRGKCQVPQETLFPGTPGRGTTTRPASKGLYAGALLADGIRQAERGTARILANDAYYSASEGAPVIQNLPVAYPGTLFQLRLKVRDDVHYTFGTSEWLRH